MIVDRFPMGMNLITPMNFAAPVVALKAGGPVFTYPFNVTTRFRVQGGALYLFDTYSMIGSITQEQFAACAAVGAPAVTDNAYVPGFSIAFRGIQGGRPENFPTLYPAIYGVVPLRAFGMSPSDEEFEIVASVRGTLTWDSTAYPTEPDYVSFLYGLTVYQIRDEKVIEAYKAGELSGWRP